MLRSVWQSDRSHKLSKFVWDTFTEEECQAAAKWLENAKEGLEELSYMTGGAGSVDEFPEGPLEELGTALYLCTRCRPEEMAPKAQEQG